MKQIFYVFFILKSLLFSDTLDTLLDEYEDTMQNSLHTVDEKLGHVIIYSQKELKLMQHNKLSDVLKELPLLNLNRNYFGSLTPSLPGTQTPVSGFFRLFINDTEVSSLYTQSFSLTWGEMPLDFIDHIEVYYGESSFSQSNETGVYFIRVYTKSAQKENGSQYNTVFSNKDFNSQSLTHADSFDNGWSYLLFLNQSKSNDTNTYNDELLTNSIKSRYLYLDIQNDTTKINIGYNDTQQDLYLGASLDAKPDDGSLKSKDYFIDISSSLLNDKSLKIGASYSVSQRIHEEKNAEGIWIIPVIDFTPNTILKEIEDDIQIDKSLLYITKDFNFTNNHIATTFNIQQKKYKINKRKSTNLFNQETVNEEYNNFNKETVSSLIFTDEYNLFDNLVLIGNVKFDKYKRYDYFKDSSEEMYRIGTIYTPFKNFGIKSFYTKTHLPPSFSDADYSSFRNKNIKTQQYKFFTYEVVFTTEKAKYGLTYNNVKIDNFIYQTPIGFENIDHQIKNKGVALNFEYIFSKKNQIALNYYTTDSSEEINNSDKGGYIKYMGSYGKFSYFSSIIYRNKYSYKPTDSNHVSVKDSYNLNMGVTYNYTKDLSFSIKGENLLDKSTQSVYSNGSPDINYTLDDFNRSVFLSMKWKF